MAAAANQKNAKVMSCGAVRLRKTNRRKWKPSFAKAIRACKANVVEQPRRCFDQLLKKLFRGGYKVNRRNRSTVPCARRGWALTALLAKSASECSNSRAG